MPKLPRPNSPDMVRRKTNRRHMTGDHHGRTARRATLLVTATDEILGRHSLDGAEVQKMVAQSPAIKEWVKPTRSPY
jgi:hypothetical protein